jgi:acetyl esterase
MTLDPQIAEMLAAEASGEGPSFAIGVEESRAAEYDFIELCGPLIEMRVEDRDVPGPDGAVPVRVYAPRGDEEVRPAVVYFHGGGWVAGDLETMDRVCRNMADGAGAVVVSVHYRRAPEEIFPAAAEDAHAALAWVAANAAALGVDPARIAVAGDSAGGNLSAVVSQMARDRGGPAVAFQLLIYPVLDHDFATPSYVACADGYALTRTMMQWFWDQYVPDASRRDDPYAAPLRASSLAGLPPAAVHVAGYDPLRDEGLAYAEALRAAGVPVEVRNFETMVHGYLQLVTVSAGAAAASAAAIEALRTALAVAAPA